MHRTTAPLCLLTQMEWRASVTVSPLRHTAMLRCLTLDILEALRHLSTALRISELAAPLAGKRRVSRKRRRLYVFVVGELLGDFVYHARALIHVFQLPARIH